MQNIVQLKAARKPPFQIDTRRYARCLEVSRRISWEIDRDVIRGREFDFSKKFLPDGLSKVSELGFLGEDGRRVLSQIQGRTYANMLGLVERFIGAKILEVSGEHSLGDQTALEALVRFTGEELKHQELFRRIERMIGAAMDDQMGDKLDDKLAPGYSFAPRPNDVAWLVLGKSTWAVLALTCMIELFTQAHYRESIAWDGNLSPLWKDVFLFHWKEESQHALLDELEWRREDAKLTPKERDDAVNDLIALVGAIDTLLRQQAGRDTAYFAGVCGQTLSADEIRQVEATVLRAYRRQYILSGVEDERFGSILAGLIGEEQVVRISKALLPIAEA